MRKLSISEKKLDEVKSEIMYHHSMVLVDQILSHVVMVENALDKTHLSTATRILENLCREADKSRELISNAMHDKK